MPTKNIEIIIEKKLTENLNFAILSSSDEIESLRKLNPRTPNNVPIIIPVETIKKHSREIILKIRFFEYPIALNTAKSDSLFSRLLAKPEKIVSMAIRISKNEKNT
tara:strand:+ start:1243 stop:1560 length:318 start_codon:yes stop_codon:yes gene_type:complete